MTEKRTLLFPLRKGQFRTEGWIGAMLFVLSACATVQPGASLDKKEIVTTIAQSRWDALTKGDYETAYNMMSPASRSLVTLDAFRNKMIKVVWKGASVKKVECSADDLCKAQVDARYAYRLRMGREVENVQVLTETWRYTAGGWWYVPDDAM